MVLGRRGTGKSTLGSVLTSMYPRVVTFDYMHEHSNGEIVTSFDEFGFLLNSYHKNQTKNFHIIIQFSREAENTAAEFNECLRVLWYMGGVFVRVEEIHNYCTTHFMPHWLGQCLTTGRHKNMGMLFTTQMPRYTNKALISQCEHLFCGQLHERHDIEYVRSVLHDRAYDLPALPRRKFLYFQPGQPIRVVNNSLD